MTSASVFKFSHKMVWILCSPHRQRNAPHNKDNIVGPLIIEPIWAKNRVSTGVLGALVDSLVVQTKI